MFLPKSIKATDRPMFNINTFQFQNVDEKELWMIINDHLVMKKSIQKISRERGIKPEVIKNMIVNWKRRYKKKKEQAI